MGAIVVHVYLHKERETEMISSDQPSMNWPTQISPHVNRSLIVSMA